MSTTAPTASPIQVVLRAESFVRDVDPGKFGPNKDFFAGADEKYAAHRKAILDQLRLSAAQLAEPGSLGMGYLKVSVRTRALAKSHRPTHALFRSDRTRQVGMGGPGELIVAVTPDELSSVAATVAKTEDLTRYRDDVSKDPNRPPRRVPNPSRARSEVGAISQLSLWTSTDRRRFSAHQSIEWLRDPRTGSFYLVELFEDLPSPSHWDSLAPELRRLFQSFRATLLSLGPGLRAERIATRRGSPTLIALWLLESDRPTEIFFEPIRRDRVESAEVDFSLTRHQALLQRLDEHPLVKRIHLPPVLHVQAPPLEEAAADSAALQRWPSPERSPERRYPRVAVIDGGLADSLSDWVVDRWDFVSQADESLEHATFIGGLLVAGGSLNPRAVRLDADGCELVDVKLLPTEDDPTAFRRYYGKSGTVGFIDELRDAVATLRQRANVRIFNLSANFESSAGPGRYEPITAMLDDIADAHDVLFVISAGNANGTSARAEWPENPVEAMAILAASNEDRILSPAESVRGISVGALNPPHIKHVVAHAPAAYSRRGPGLPTGLKPDVAHVGGAGTARDGDTGLWSLHPKGHIYASAGTSYAAPLVAKTLAALEHEIEGEVSRETLIALLLHHSHLPPALRNPAFGRVARQLVGFGLPPPAYEILGGLEHQITMVFSTRLPPRRRLEFEFAWPSSLVRPGGKCRGFAQMTLVATPPTDPRADSELVRVDLKAHLNQLCKGGANASCGWLPAKGTKEHVQEARLIADQMKWSPAKVYQWRSSQGKGKSSNWRLAVSRLSRDDHPLPSDGVPFSILLTIGDLDQVAPVFQEMRQMLQSQGVQLERIQTAARVSPRV